VNIPFGFLSGNSGFGNLAARYGQASIQGKDLIGNRETDRRQAPVAAPEMTMGLVRL
jgi:hypothetical protein